MKISSRFGRDGRTLLKEKLYSKCLAKDTKYEQLLGRQPKHILIFMDNEAALEMNFICNHSFLNSLCRM